VVGDPEGVLAVRKKHWGRVAAAAGAFANRSCLVDATRVFMPSQTSLVCADDIASPTLSPLVRHPPTVTDLSLGLQFKSCPQTHWQIRAALSESESENGHHRP